MIKALAIGGALVGTAFSLPTTTASVSTDPVPNRAQEFVVDGTLRVNDYFYLTTPFPVVNTSYSELIGVLDFRNGNQKLEPRDAGDLVLGSPVLSGLSPALSYVRTGQMGVQTIPTPLTVTLSAPAEG